MTMDEKALERARRAWRYRGQTRPPFAATPAEHQESVWDYPRPPAYVPDQRSVEVYAGDALLARTDRSVRVLETGSPPAFYLPPDAVDRSLLQASRHRTFCEWKGAAEYFHARAGGVLIENAVWCYPAAFDAAAAIAGWYSFYPTPLRCYVDGERVRSQPGGYYGGWITDEIVGPFKGEPGTGHW